MHICSLGTLKGVFKMLTTLRKGARKKPIEPKPAVEDVITQLNLETTGSYITKEIQPCWRQIAFVLLEKGRFC